MNQSNTEEFHRSDDDRLVSAVREYQAAADAGRAPDRGQFLSRFADIADELAECLDGLSFLRSAAPGLRPPEAAAQEGVLGDFRLLREIGRGGMGVVYEAEQISLGRRVALKVLPLAGTLDSRQMARFENEARAAAALHHANIVPVFAVGRERGVPYYAMQFIDGCTLADVIGREPPEPDATAAHARSRTKLTGSGREFFRDAVKLILQAAEALEYAHQMGVVHRDVKPANLLLDDRGNLWVADFGLARIQSAPGVTTPGDLVGTLRYMSPEQAAGLPVIDPRSDVYSLGATLYELLTRRPAFDGRDRRELLRQVLEEEPTPPRRAEPALPAELETVVLKAMAKRPEERYASAKDLADDLRRFLDDRPIAARPPGLWERLAKWSRRHRRLVGAAVVCLAGLVLVLGATTYRVSIAEGRAREALEDETTQRERAEASYKQARKVLDFVTRFGTDELDDRPEYQAVRRHLLTALLSYYEEFIEQNKTDEAELIETRLKVANLLAGVGRPEEAWAQYQRAARDGERFGGGPFGGGPPRGLIRVFLLSSPDVQRELKLSPEQAKRLAPFSDPHRKPRPGAGLAEAEMMADKVLTPAQSERLRQIIRQLRGAEAILEAADELGLTADQTHEIRSRLGRFGPPGKGKGKGKLPMPKDRKREDELARSVLTAEQFARWQKMLGEPFRGDVRLGPPRPPPDR